MTEIDDLVASLALAFNDNDSKMQKQSKQTPIDWDLFKSRLENIKPFNGDSNVLNKFVTKCDKLVNIYRQLQSEELDAHIFDCIQEKLIEKAEVMVGNRTELTNWDALKAALQQCFSDRRNTDNLVQELTRARPFKGEHLISFGTRLQLLRSNVAQRISNDLNLSEQQKICHITYYEKTALNTFIAGCTGTLKNNMHLKKLDTLEDAMAYVVEFENFEKLYGNLNATEKYSNNQFAPKPTNFSNYPKFSNNQNYSNQNPFNQNQFNQNAFNRNPNFNQQQYSTMAKPFQWPSQPINVQPRQFAPQKFFTNREVFGPPKNVFKPKNIPPSQMSKPTPMSISVRNSNGFSRQPIRNQFNHFQNTYPNQKPNFTFEELHNNECEGYPVEDYQDYSYYEPNEETHLDYHVNNYGEDEQQKNEEFSENENLKEIGNFTEQAQNEGQP